MLVHSRQLHNQEQGLMRQDSFSEGGFEKYREKARKEQFLEGMDSVIPWKELIEVIEPFYPKPKGAGRRPTGIDLGRGPVPDETTICKFLHLVNQYPQENGMKVSRGTIVDASIISTPSSTKNKKKARDPEMRQTRKGNQWYFGMKAHIGVDSRIKLIHSMVTTSANVHDYQVLPDLLHGEETPVWGDAAYSGQRQAITDYAPRARDFTQAKGSHNRKLTEAELARNRNKSRVRAKVEHQFGIIKRQFGFSKVRYRGLDKNAHRLFVACALSNLVIANETLLK